MLDLNKKMAELRAQADTTHRAAKDKRTEAARIYSTVDRIWAAKVVSDEIRSEFKAIGLADLEPDLIDKTIDEAVVRIVEGGGLSA
jgi:hypothetical protein